MLCGHSCCGGAGAALSDGRVGGVIDAWITPLRQIRKSNEEELKAITSDAQRAVRLAELNVEEGVKVLMSNYVVDEAIRERGLKVHGSLYDIASGKIRDLKVGTAGKHFGKMGLGASDEEHVVTGNHAQLVFGGDGASMQVR